MNLAFKIQPTDTPLHGALTSLYCASHPEAAQIGAGGYFTPVAKLKADPRGWVSDKKGNVELWEWSEEIFNQVGK